MTQEQTLLPCPFCDAPGALLQEKFKFTLATCAGACQITMPIEKWNSRARFLPAASEAEFKNFHRALCERFDYCHDERDWKRDQVSLIEHIAKKVAASEAGALLRKASEGIDAELDGTWECNSHHPKLWAAKEALDAALKGTPPTPVEAGAVSDNRIAHAKMHADTAASLLMDAHAKAPDTWRGWYDDALNHIDIARKDLAAIAAPHAQPEKQGGLSALCPDAMGSLLHGAVETFDAGYRAGHAAQPATVAQDCTACHGAGKIGTPGRHCEFCNGIGNPAPAAQGDERAAFEAEYPAEYLAMKQKRAPFDVTEFAFAIWQRARAALSRQQGGGDAEPDYADLLRQAAEYIRHPDYDWHLDFIREVDAALAARAQRAAAQHASDCALHNGPAYEPKPCDCGANPGEQPDPARHEFPPGVQAAEPCTHEHIDRDIANHAVRCLDCGKSAAIWTPKDADQGDGDGR